MKKRKPKLKAATIGSRRMVWFVGTVTALFLITVVVYGQYYAPPPSLREPVCLQGETALFNGRWWCVTAREP